MNGPVAQPGRAAEAFAAEAFKPAEQKSSDKMKTPVRKGEWSRVRIPPGPFKQKNPTNLNFLIQKGTWKIYEQNS